MSAKTLMPYYLFTFGTTAERLAYVFQPNDVGGIVRDQEDTLLYIVKRSGAGAATMVELSNTYTDQGSLRVADPAVIKPTQAPPLNVPAAGFVTIPAPAAGYIRVLHLLGLTSLGSTPNYNATLEPSGLYVAGRATTGGAATGVTVALPNAVMIFFGAAETVKVANGGTADATLTYWYTDIVATNRALVRAQYGNVGNAAVEVIPTAPAGYYRRFVPFERQAGVAWSLQSLSAIINDDTAAVVSDWLLGSTVVARNGSLAAAGNTAPTNALDFIITTEAFNVKAQAAATDGTRRPIVFACYETIPYTFAPNLASLGTATGSAAGGTAVVARGEGLAWATGVTVGGVAATSVTSTDASVTFTTPAHAAGVVDVVVTTLVGTSRLAGSFTYT